MCGKGWFTSAYIKPLSIFSASMTPDFCAEAISHTLRCAWARPELTAVLWIHILHACLTSGLVFILLTWWYTNTTCWFAASWYHPPREFRCTVHYGSFICMGAMEQNKTEQLCRRRQKNSGGFGCPPKSVQNLVPHRNACEKNKTTTHTKQTKERDIEWNPSLRNDVYYWEGLQQYTDNVKTTTLHNMWSLWAMTPAINSQIYYY